MPRSATCRSGVDLADSDSRRTPSRRQRHLVAGVADGGIRHTASYSTFVSRSTAVMVAAVERSALGSIRRTFGGSKVNPTVN